MGFCEYSSFHDQGRRGLRSGLQVLLLGSVKRTNVMIHFSEPKVGARREIDRPNAAELNLLRRALFVSAACRVAVRDDGGNPIRDSQTGNNTRQTVLA